MTESVTIQLEMDASVHQELAYVVALLRRGPDGHWVDSVPALISWVLACVADGSRRPGSWERDAISAMGLVSECDEHHAYRAEDGPPAGSGSQPQTATGHGPAFRLGCGHHTSQNRLRDVMDQCRGLSSNMSPTGSGRPAINSGSRL